MSNKDYVAPLFNLDGFNCPHCGAFAHHKRYEAGYWMAGFYSLDLTISMCAKCEKYCIWNIEKKEMIRPNISTAPLPDEDMPNEVKELYEEARQVSTFSPRAAAALLRVSLEKLTAFLGETEGNLNTRIKNLNKRGLPEKVIQSLDALRITANEGGSHAGEIDLTDEDNQEIVNGLFFLVNFIVERVISGPKRVDEIYGKLPENKLKGIKDRDSN